MILKGLIDEDFCQYKKPAMFIIFPFCTFKCNRECGQQVCQNGTLTMSENINIEAEAIRDRYLNNPITSSIVCGGLEPFDTFQDLCQLIVSIRKLCDDDIVIYTGYKKEELQNEIDILSDFKNIIIKFGRYIPNQSQHYDEVLGIYLASDNQYAERISL